VAADLSRREYKPLGMDLLDKSRRWHERIIQDVMEFDHRAHLAREAGRPFDTAIHSRLRHAAVAKAVEPLVAALNDALVRNGDAVTQLRQAVDAFLRSMNVQSLRRVAAAVWGHTAAPARPTSNPGPS
jgi:hypothetical protein